MFYSFRCFDYEEFSPMHISLKSRNILITGATIDMNAGSYVH